MPGLLMHRTAAASLIQDQDIYLVDAKKTDLTITVMGAADEAVMKQA